MEALHFFRPWWLCALVPLVALWWWYGFSRHRQSAWNRAIEPAFVRLLVGHGAGGNWWRKPRHLLALACVVAVVALAGPAWQRAPQGVFRSNAALVIALDLSQSMLAQDVAPSRLQRARLKILSLLQQRQHGDTALIAYAAHAYAVTPLTYDVRTLANLVPALNPGIMPSQGDNPRAALALAARLIHSARRDEGDVLLVTDDLAGQDPAGLAAFAQQHGLRVSVLAVATPQPTPIPNLDGVGNLQDQGRTVTSALDAAPLQELAKATGGRYQPVRRDARDIAQLGKLFATRHGTSHAVAGRAAEQWRPLGPWLLLLLCLPLVVVLFRRNLLFVLALVVLAPMAQSHAAGSPAWFQNNNQRGLAAYQRGDYSKAQQLFSDPRWRAAAAYRQGNLKTALSLYAGQDDIASVYDRGNVLVKLGRFQQALAAYNEVLARDPGNRDAAYNKAQVLKLLNALNKNQQSRRSRQSSDHSKNGQRQKGRNRQKSAQTEHKPKPPKSAQGEQKKSAQRSAEAASKRGSRHKKPSSALQATQAQKQRQRQAAQYRLRRIPDDPSGLLRRKFDYEYQHRLDRGNVGDAP